HLPHPSVFPYTTLFRSTRVFSLVSFGVAAVYSVVMPDMFDLAKDREALLRKIGEANLAAAGIAVALFAAVALGGPLALLLFGPRSEEHTSELQSRENLV